MAKIAIFCDTADPAEKGAVYCDGLPIGTVFWTREGYCVDVEVYLCVRDEKLRKVVEKLVRRLFGRKYEVRKVRVEVDAE